MKLKVYTDISDCQKLWEIFWPGKGIFDLWQVRTCFHHQFQRQLRFQTVESNGQVLGLLPLSWCEESGQYVFFPGETWQGKTWLEQNRIIAKDREIFQILIQAAPGPVNLRYLSQTPLLETLGQVVEDEKGYLFYPAICDYNFENYWLGFSGKSRKKIKKERAVLEAVGVNIRVNELDDLGELVRLNTTSFSTNSYFHDPRFHAAFSQLASLLKEMGLLRITTILIGGEVAAVDMGAVFNNTYTLLAGGTDPRFKGVAKLINLYHLEWACQKRINTVDFLCGDFNWKERFHLVPRPLYQISKNQNQSAASGTESYEERICA